MQHYSPTLGLYLTTREQNLEKVYQWLIESGNFQGSYELFLGSNWHRLLSSSVLPLLEEQQAQFVSAQSALFSFWQEHNLAIKGSLGASYEGFLECFRPYTTSIHLATMEEDQRLSYPGEIAIYFDNLQVKDETILGDLFRKTMPLATFTPFGDYAIEVNFTGANARTYRYHNLLPKDYTLLDLRIYVAYKQGTVSYNNEKIIDSVIEEFTQSNRIGRSFYPRSYFNHALLPNLASMRIESSLEHEVNYNDQIQVARLGQKFALRNIEVIEISAHQGDR